jgi:hypothetical protein
VSAGGRAQAKEQNSGIYASSDDEDFQARARETELRRALQSREKEKADKEKSKKEEKAKKEEVKAELKAEPAGESDMLFADAVADGGSESESDEEKDERKKGKKGKDKKDKKGKQDKKAKKEAKREKKRRKKERKRSPSPSGSSSSEGGAGPAAGDAPVLTEEHEAMLAFEAKKKQVTIDEDDLEAGPALPVSADAIAGEMTEASYGGALRPGEGTAMASYVQEGKRIPRRGEVGMKAEEIESYEKEGFVMSGSRHKRMNAVRMRKENQVYSAEEKRALAMFNFEERQQRENTILSEFKQMMAGKFAGASDK